MNMKTKISNYSLYKRNFLSDDVESGKNERALQDVVRNPSISKAKTACGSALMR